MHSTMKLAPLLLNLLTICNIYVSGQSSATRIPRAMTTRAPLDTASMLANLTTPATEVLHKFNETSNGTTCSGPNCAQVPQESHEDNVRPDLWCPGGYDLITIGGEWTQLCRPQSCVELPLVNSSYTTTFPNNTKVTIDDQRRVVKVCTRRLSAKFLSCPGHIVLSAGQYDILADTGLQGPSGPPVALGDYWLRGSEAVLCGSGPALSPRWCMPFSTNETVHVQPDGSLNVSGVALDAPKGYFSTVAMDTEIKSANVCVPVDPAIEACTDFVPFEAGEFDVRPNMDLHTNLAIEVVYPLGHYLLAVDRSASYVCHVSGGVQRAETLYLYGSVALVSATCLLLALVAHIFFPSLNYHTKALLCLAFCLFVMYIAIAVRNFARSFESPEGNVAIFAIQYTFALAAFFWLSVISYDLWRVFSQMKGTITPGNTSGKKRVFFAKCVYAFGIPTIMCIIVVSISYSRSAQVTLKLDLPLQEMNWFVDTRAMFAFFYGPILIILVENVVFFILTIINIRKASCGTSIVNKKVNKRLFRVYVKLFLVMGICWFAEVISWAAKSATDETAWYATDIINCLQGVFIFLIYVCKRRTLRIIQVKLGYRSESQAASTSSTQDTERKISTISLENVQKVEQHSNHYVKM